MPPSIHSDTGEPYYWWTDETLADYRPEELLELPEDIAEQIGEVLKPFGYDPEGDRQTMPRGPQTPHAGTVSGAVSLWRETNDKALANLATWVPALGLYRCRTKPGGYCAVATWRASGTGRAIEQRKRNLSIVSKGIEDFGDGRKYTPIDLVMKARNCDKSAALDCLLERLPDDEPKITLVNGPKTLERLRARDHQNL